MTSSLWSTLFFLCFSNYKYLLNTSAKIKAQVYLAYVVPTITYCSQARLPDNSQTKETEKYKKSIREKNLLCRRRR